MELGFSGIVSLTDSFGLVRSNKIVFLANPSPWLLPKLKADVCVSSSSCLASAFSLISARSPAFVTESKSQEKKIVADPVPIEVKLIFSSLK